MYIEGYCFGDPRAIGSITPPGASITLDGEPMADIVFWTDAEIAFRPPSGAASGNLLAASQSYGSDDTTLVTACEPYPNTGRGKCK